MFHNDSDVVPETSCCCVSVLHGRDEITSMHAVQTREPRPKRHSDFCHHHFDWRLTFRPIERIRLVHSLTRNSSTTSIL
jgi:hypothetical protein